MSRNILLALALVCGIAQAAPEQFSLEYEVIRNGVRLGTVSDSFSRNGSRYRLTSATEAEGAFRLLMPGGVRFESSGKVGAAGLQPLQFQHIRGDAPAKSATTTFDWEQRQVRHQYKGQNKQHELRNGAQDQLSVLYQFAFLSALPPELNLQVASGKSTKDYRYLRSDGGPVDTPAGRFATQLYQRVDHAADDKSVSIWIAPALHNLPVQVRISGDGAAIEQRLIRSSLKE
jgi:hypothetical protein